MADTPRDPTLGPEPQETNTPPPPSSEVEIPPPSETRPADESTRNQAASSSGDNSTRANNPQPAEQRISRIKCNKQEFFYPALKYQFEPTDAILMEMPDQSEYYDAFGLYMGEYNEPASNGKVINRMRKLFVAATAEDDLIYMDPTNLADPRAILKIERMVAVNDSSPFGGDSNTSPSSKLVPVAAAEEFALFIREGNFGTTGPASGLIDILLKLMSPMQQSFLKIGNQYIRNAGNSGPNLQSVSNDFDDGGRITASAEPKSLAEQMTQSFHTSKNLSLSPRTALPGFAAVPLVSNQHVYGPWINYPDKQKKTIFPFLLNDTNRRVAMENMIGSVHIEVDNDLAPWNYGGMFALDMAVELKIQEKSTYQQFLETGQLSVPGYPIFSLGDVLTESTSSIFKYEPIRTSLGGVESITINRNPNFQSPSSSNISNIQVNVGQQTETTYTFRTYQSKLSLFNKENSDRLKKLIVESRKRQKEQHQLSIALYDRMKRKNDLTFKTSFRDYLYDSLTGGNSPVEIMVGTFNAFSKEISSTKTPAVAGLSRASRTIEAHRGKVGIFDEKEISRELNNTYSSKSMMSLDGFFSAVSFYPTPHQTTMSYVKYDRKFCPICKGTSVYDKEISPTLGYPETVVKARCEYCENRSIQSNVKNFSIAESSPPYILASGLRLAIREPTGNATNTDTIIYEYVNDKSLISNPKKYLEVFGKRNINLYNLNPIIVASGEFRNVNALDNDMSGHGIEVIARGMIAPKNALDVVDNIVAGEVIVNGVSPQPLHKWDDLQNKFVPDLASFGGRLLPKDFLDLDYEFRKSYTNTGGANDSANPQLPLLNQRFMGFRGPMVMHGWGYDTEGYPVPNASGEPKMVDSFGRPWTTRSLKVYGSFDPQSRDSGDIIIGRNQVWDSTKNEWSQPFKEMAFQEKWGQTPEKWPVGPIDLRWDADRKVWVAPQPPKNVYVILEEDLILERNSRATYPARGFLDDLQFSKDPLPIGLRRVVFVKDYAGYTAPRGAKLYCKYNGDTGFYEPISKPQIIASGIIQQGFSASIFSTYAVPNNTRTQDVTKINIKFVNHLNLEAKPNHRALFIYMEGAWNLMTVGRP
jgi:hypothetical protein